MILKQAPDDRTAVTVAAPVAPADVPEEDVEDVRLTVTPQWKLIWWRIVALRLTGLSCSPWH